MVTGDNINTAKAIAIEAGILEHDWMKKRGTEGADIENDRKHAERMKYTCMEGPDFATFVGIKDEPIKVGEDGYKTPAENGGTPVTRKVVSNLQNFSIVA